MPLGLLANDSLQDLSDIARHNVASSRNTTTTKVNASVRRRQFANHGGGRSASVSEANPQQPPSFQYVGQYSEEYYFNESYHHHHTPHQNNYSDLDVFAKKPEGGGNNFICCLAPWLFTPSDKQLSHREQHSKEFSFGAGDEENESKDSSSSNILGERLSARERQAVLARLRLAQPASLQQEDLQPVVHESSAAGSERSSTSARKSLLNGIPVYDTSPLNSAGLKGILKTANSHKGSNATLNEAKLNGSMVSLSKESDSAHRRSLFPSTYEGRHSKNGYQSVSFGPFARVVNIKSRNDMEVEEKASIWWQRSDYEDFRKTGRIITRAILEGGGEIWLKQVSSTDTSGTGDIMSNPGDKWWHKFGHSRRGLEHVVSVDEGRQRQLNVKTAIRAVLEEQERQKLRHRLMDHEKLRSVALHYTSWARDLALASGSSDADAVQSSFASDRRSREFYLLKMSRGTENRKTHAVPEFMQPLSHLRPSARPLVHPNLDANTAAQIQMRRRRSLAKPPNQSGVETSVPVHDNTNGDHEQKCSISKQAAGFADGKPIDISTVLTGMGAALDPNDEQLASMAVVS